MRRRLAKKIYNNPFRYSPGRYRKAIARLFGHKYADELDQISREFAEQMEVAFWRNDPGTMPYWTARTPIEGAGEGR